MYACVVVVCMVVLVGMVVVVGMMVVLIAVSITCSSSPVIASSVFCFKRFKKKNLFVEATNQRLAVSGEFFFKQNNKKIEHEGIPLPSG